MLRVIMGGCTIDRQTTLLAGPLHTASDNIGNGEKEKKRQGEGTESRNRNNSTNEYSCAIDSNDNNDSVYEWLYSEYIDSTYCYGHV